MSPARTKRTEAAEAVEAEGGRVANDAYYTDPDLALEICKRLHQLIPDVDGRPFKVLEPSAGKGAFCKAVWDCWAVDGSEVRITAVEPFAAANDGLFAHTVVNATIEHFVTGAWAAERFDLTIGNPPYLLAEEHLALVRPISMYTAFLLRLAFLGSQGRAERIFNKPGLRYLMNIAQRPSFIMGKTDNSEYACFVFQHGYTGLAQILPPLWVTK